MQKQLVDTREKICQCKVCKANKVIFVCIVKMVVALPSVQLVERGASIPKTQSSTNDNEVGNLRQTHKPIIECVKIVVIIMA